MHARGYQFDSGTIHSVFNHIKCFGFVAQLAEYSLDKRRVAGSSPVEPIFFNRLPTLINVLISTTISVNNIYIYIAVWIVPWNLWQHNY